MAAAICWLADEHPSFPGRRDLCCFRGAVQRFKPNQSRCSGAVGLLAGAGFWPQAAIAAILVVSVNLVLRPLVRLVNRQPIESAEIETSYVVTVTCQSADEAQIRALLVQGFGVSDLHLRELQSSDIEETGRVEVTARLTSQKQ